MYYLQQEVTETLCPFVYGDEQFLNGHEQSSL